MPNNLIKISLFAITYMPAVWKIIFFNATFDKLCKYDNENINLELVPAYTMLTDSIKNSN